MDYRVAIIGTGPDPKHRDRDGFAMAYRHAPGYLRLDECTLVSCADIVPEHAKAFADHFDLSSWYDDHVDMLVEEDIDIVSICVPPAAHAELVVDCAELGDVTAIHCEKPMAATWGDCQQMVDVCDTHEVQLTIGHQRRLAAPVTKAKRLIDDGEIGSIRRFEWSELNLFDAGSHLFDLCDHFSDGARPSWALAAVDVDPDNRWFGALNDAQAVATWGYENGIIGFASTAENDDLTGVDAYLRIVGDSGVIEIEPNAGPSLRMRTAGNNYQSIDTGGESIYRPPQSLARAATNKVFRAVPGVRKELKGEPTHYERAIEHVVSSLVADTEPVFSANHVIRGTELVFACYESARQQARVDLPLDIEDNPLETMCEEQFPPEANPPTTRI